AGCVQELLEPSHRSRVQGLVSAVHGVPAGFFTSAGQAVLTPLHTSWRSHSKVAARHTVPVGFTPSEGQLADPPVQFSALSQSPAAGRHVPLEARYWQVGVQ